MPATKPKALISKHLTADESAARTSAESAMRPRIPLTVRPPKALRGRKHAAETWTRIRELFAATDGEIVTSFDESILAKYCILDEEGLTLERVRDDTLKAYEVLQKQVAKMRLNEKTLKDYIKLLEQMNALLERYKGLDARLDGKRKLQFSMEQSMYLTPRSRAGVTPPEKQEKPKDELDELLGG